MYGSQPLPGRQLHTGEESLIVDNRSNRRPTEIVEEKLSKLLQGRPVLVRGMRPARPTA